jgi:hypothetical protein
MKSTVVEGKKLWNLTAIQKCASVHGHTQWLFQCVCGRTRVATAASVVSGRIKCCGSTNCGGKTPTTKPLTWTCKFCTKNYPFTNDFFPARKHSLWGLSTKCRSCTNRRARSYNKPERSKLRIAVLTHYSLKGYLSCSCSGCSEKHAEFLTLDHVDGGGREERKKYPGSTLFRRLRRLGFPSGYRTLCWNCNSSLGVYGYCPHEAEKSGPAGA